ncbi:hypothetical protein K435DRAFT_853107 [Dendrothele bispora CBS 962.96]|uniref:Helicase ATP-binding domain-containing protein n=1 Tax=Dendrothele bispora (strain CBS 962.96) TaxID=1314807 RepID=A0A4S8MHV5_DENBC|nr:hypothetical protein K435DRAFT_853107 [Dendrothele bispora CBS 962.96]
MPEIRLYIALLCLYFLDDNIRYPWCMLLWQDITGIKDDLLGETLPPGWSQEMQYEIRLFFDQYRILDKEDERTHMWEVKWKIHTTITECFSEENIHPLLLIKAQNNLSMWPGADMYIPQCLEAMVSKLFGAEAFGERGILIHGFQCTLHLFATWSWSRLRRTMERDLKKMAKKQAEADAAFDALAKASPMTDTMVTKVITLVGDWKKLTLIYSDSATTAKANDMLDEVNRIMVEIGAQKAPPKAKGKAKGSGKALTGFKKSANNYIATDEGLLWITGLYDQYFGADKNNNDHEDEDPSAYSRELNRENIDDEGGDLGTEMESKMSYEGTQNCWDTPSLFNKPSPDRVPTSLHWHQLSGAHSVMRNLFKSSPDASACTGMLISDEVGLGKTALCLTILATLNQFCTLQERNEPLPSVVDGLPFLKDSSKIPNLPHVIVVPGTVLQQWIDEIKILFISMSIDLFVYTCPKSGNAEFWGPESPLSKSKQEPRNRIIITTHSSLQNDFTSAFRSKQDKGKDPWILPRRLSKPLDGMISEQQFLTVAIDELHQVKNIGTKYFSALALAKQASVTLGLTGTPLMTAPKDIASLGRILGIPYFLSRQSIEEGKEYDRNVRKARKLDNDGLELHKTQIRAVSQMQAVFSGHFIRRTQDSKNWLGNKLLDLPPYETIVGVINLTEREKQIMQVRAEEAKANVSTANEMSAFFTKMFYLEYRLAIAYAKLHSDSPPPVFESIEEWEPIQSSKMTLAAKLCRHYLQADNVGDVKFRDREV